MNERIRIMHLVENLDVGGMENGLVNLANHFDYNRFDFMICCFRDKGKLGERLQKAETRLLEMNYGPGAHLDAILPLAGHLRHNRVHILHTHGWGARSFIGLLAARLAHIPACVNGEHGQLHISTRRQLIIQQAILPLFDDNLSVSAGLKEKIYQQVGVRRSVSFTVIPNGVDTEKFKGNYPHEELRRELNLEQNAFVVAVIGSLKYQKNQGSVLRALARLKEKSSDIEILLIGDGPDRIMLEELARALDVAGRVKFLGVRNDIAHLLSLVHVLISSSILDFEGMSNVILEAMASGVPILATQSVGIGELIDGEKTGLLFEPDRVEDLAAKILFLKENPDLRKTIAANARDLVFRKHSLQMMVQRYQNYYQELYNRMTWKR